MAGCSASPSLCATVTTVVCGSLAAMHTRGNVAGSLKDNGAQSAPRASRSFVRSALIAAQVAFSYMLLIGAGLMVNSLIQLQRVDPGFVPQRVFAVGVDLNFTKYPDAQSQRMAATAPAGAHPAAARRPLRRGLVQLPDGCRQRRRRPSAALPRLRRQPAGDRDAARAIGPPRHAGLLPHRRHSADRRPGLPRFRHARTLPWSSW